MVSPRLKGLSIAVRTEHFKVSRWIKNPLGFSQGSVKVKDRTARLYLTIPLPSNTTTTSVEDRLTLQLKNIQKLEVTSLDTAIAQLQTEVAELENHRKNLVEEKRKQEQESLQQKIEQGVQQLEALAAHINALVTQLETETLKF